MAKPKINQDLCTGCGLCVEACETGTLALKDETAVLADRRGCDGCGTCAAACPTEALVMR